MKAHPCAICGEPTANPQVCSRVFSCKLARKSSPASNPGPRPHRRIPTRKRFFNTLVKGADNECWPWYGTHSAKGYPLIWDTETKSQVSATRLCFEIFKGPIPQGYIVSPVCETRDCLNPRHLVSGRRGEIIARRLRLNRKTARYGDDNHSSRISDTLVAQIRGLHKERQFAEIHAIANEHGMSREYLVSVGRTSGRKRRGTKKTQSYLSDSEINYIRQLHDERNFKAVRQFADEKGMSYDYLMEIGRGRKGRKMATVA